MAFARGARLAERLHMMRTWLVLGSLLFAGCNLYFGGGGDDCKDYADDVAVWELRNPQTGECEAQYGGGGGGGCYDAAPVNTGIGALPNWPTCGGACDALAENECLATAGCHAEYTGFTCPPGYDCAALWSGTQFWTCSATAPYAPEPRPACWGLDAQSCAGRDDCASVYQIPEDPPDHHSFNQCTPEPSADVCGAIDCGLGSHCEPQCYPCDKVNPDDVCMTQCQPTCVPDVESCATIDCGPGAHCEEYCAGACDPNSDGPCPDVCKAACVSDGNDPGECYGAVACDAKPPACPAGTTPGVTNACWSGYCIPTSECSHDPGTCDGKVACATPPPACPSGTTPGVKNGCWSGYCIPDAVCATSIACEAITTEGACVARPDCAPIYDGKVCTCDANGTCTCEDKVFARCQTLWLPD
jgi:hypothetical protein